LITSLIGARITIAPTILLQLFGYFIHGIIVSFVPEYQLIETTSAVAADQINGRFIGTLIVQHHAVSSTTHMDRVHIEANIKACALGVGQIAAYWQATEEKRWRWRANGLASGAQHGCGQNSTTKQQVNCPSSGLVTHTSPEGVAQKSPSHRSPCSLDCSYHVSRLWVAQPAREHE
jgi:hypothetical protein